MSRPEEQYGCEKGIRQPNPSISRRRRTLPVGSKKRHFRSGACTVERGNLVIRLKSPGEAFTKKKALIKAELTGVVREVRADEGKRVREGEVLVVLDDLSSRLRLKKAEAERLNRLSEMLSENQFERIGRGNPRTR